jgi:DNA-binding response OmpR family regulator
MPKVLIIDDSRYARLKLSKPITDAGFEVLEAENGLEGLDLVRREAPDCVLCDLLMPVMDGYGFLENIKKEGITVPVLVLTSDIQEKTRKRTLELGAVDLINKPPKYDEVVKRIYTVIEGGK